MASAVILRADHSPLPWRAYPEDTLGAGLVFSGSRDLSEEQILICDAADVEALQRGGESRDDFRSRSLSNAAFIVRACNAHYQMLEALKDIAQAMDAKRQIWSREMSAFKRDLMLASNDAHFRKAEDKVRAAIAAAEREAGQ